LYTGFNIPLGVAVDSGGDVYVSNLAGGTVQELVAVNGSIPAQPAINTVGGFSNPDLLASDAGGNVLVTDRETFTVSEIYPVVPNLGTLNIGSTSATYTLNFGVTQTTSIGAINYLTLGVQNQDYKALANDSSSTLCTVQTYNTSITCTLDVTFTPTAPGQRKGAVQILDNSIPANVLATVYLNGTGVGPLATFSPSTISTLGSGFSSPNQVAVDGSGNVYVTDYNFNTHVSALKMMQPGCLPGNSSLCEVTLGAGFNYPNGVAIDGAGNIYVADAMNNAVKEMTSACAISNIPTCILTLALDLLRPKA
jgi:hypothetical protein